jgi:hypothetical protein
MNPIPDEPTHPASIVSEVRRARDSCILLAGHRPYREFPLDWMRRHLETSKFSIVGSKNFTILHSQESIVRQVKVAQSKLPLIVNVDVKKGMEKYLVDLEARARSAVREAGGKIPLSFDYVIAAEHQHSQQLLLDALADTDSIPPLPPSSGTDLDIDSTSGLSMSLGLLSPEKP